MAVRLFISYSLKDQELCRELSSHLVLLTQQKIIEVWHARELLPGATRETEIDDHLRRADMILLLVSASFLASNDKEIRLALEQQRSGKACVVPIILRPVDLTQAPFAKLQHLPPEGRPVTLWRNRDEAWANVATGIGRIARSLDLRAESGTLNQANRPPLPSVLHTPARLYDQTDFNIRIGGPRDQAQQNISFHTHGVTRDPSPPSSEDKMSSSIHPKNIPSWMIAGIIVLTILVISVVAAMCR